MIELQKGPVPRWLSDHAEQKTLEYKEAPAESKPSPWRRGEVVDALKRESSKKCMYCESLIDDVSYSAVEHIRPKSVFEDLVLEWTNLGLVCSRCNTNKGSYWTDNDSLRMLNPYEDALDDHIVFHGPLTSARLESSRAKNTIVRLKLHSREDLLLARMMRIQELGNLLRLWHDAQDHELKALYAEEVEAATSNEREHAGVLKAYADSLGFPFTQN